MLSRSPRTQFWLRTLLLLAVSLVPRFAVADGFQEIAGTWDIYAYANGQQLYEILHAINGWMTSGGFIAFITGMAILGLLGVSMMGFFSGSPHKAGGYLMAIVVSSYVFTSMGTRVVITDMVTGDAKPALEVSAAAGLPLGVVSEVGGYVARAIETTFQSTSSPSIDGGGYPIMMPDGSGSKGMPFGGTYGVMRDINNFKIADPAIRSNVTEYLRYCFIPFIDTWYPPKSVLEADNFWEQLKNGVGGTPPKNQYILYNNPDTGDKKLISCEEGHKDISSDLGKYVPAVLGRFTGASQLVAGASTAASVNVTEWLSNSATSNTNMAINAAMVEATREGFQRTAHALGSDTMMVAINTENARRAQTAGWYTTAILFRDMVGYFFAILQGFVVAITPLVAIMAFMPGMGLKLIGGYSKVLVWMMMWWPSLTIVNFIMNSYYKANMLSTANKCAGASFGCPASLGLMNDMTQNMMIAAGLMATFVPAIMWGIVSQGSFALTSVLDRASGAGFATQAGGNIAHGSARVGEVAMNNVSANKHDTTWRNTSGMEASQTYTGAGQHILNEQQGGIGSSTAGAANRHDLSASFSQQIANSQKREEAYGQDAALATQNALNAISSYGRQYSEDKSLSNTHSLTFDTEESARMALSLDTVTANQYREALENGTKTSEQVTSELKADYGLARAGTIAGRIGGSYTKSSSFQETFGDTSSMSYDYKDSSGDTRSVGSGAMAGETAAERRAITEKEIESWDSRVGASVMDSFNKQRKYSEQAALTKSLEAREAWVAGRTSNRSMTIAEAREMEKEHETFMREIEAQQASIEKGVRQGEGTVMGEGEELEAQVSSRQAKFDNEASTSVLDEDEFREQYEGVVKEAGGRIGRAQALVAGAATAQNVDNALHALEELGGKTSEDVAEQVKANQEIIDKSRENGWDVSDNKLASKEQDVHLALFNSHDGNRKFRGMLENRNEAIADYRNEVSDIWAERDEAVKNGTSPSIANRMAGFKIDNAGERFQERVNKEFSEPLKALGESLKDRGGMGSRAAVAIDNYFASQEGWFGKLTKESKQYNEDLRGSRSGPDAMYRTAEKQNDYAAALQAQTENTRLMAAHKRLEGVQNFHRMDGRYQLVGVNNENGQLVYSSPIKGEDGKTQTQYFELDNNTRDGQVFTPIDKSAVQEREDLQKIANSKPDYRMDLGGQSQTSPGSKASHRGVRPL